MPAPDPELGVRLAAETTAMNSPQPWSKLLASAALFPEDGQPKLYAESAENQPAGIDIEVLQRMVFYQLQKELTSKVSTIVQESAATEETMLSVRVLLKQYCMYEP
jgi:hypothetical protein